MKFVKSLKAVAAGVIAAFGLSAGSANAFFLYSSAVLEDDDIEQILDRDGNVKTTGALVVGDRLRAIIEINKIVDKFGVVPEQTLSTGGQPELTGLSEIQIVDIQALGPTQSRIIFAPSSAFATELAGIAGGVAADYAGAMVALWTDPSNNLVLSDQVVSCNNFDTTCTANATDGSLWAVAGFGADPDRFWFADVSNAVLNNIGLLPLADPSSKLASYNYMMEVLVNNTGYQFGPLLNVLCDPAVCTGDFANQIVGSGDVLGGLGLTNGAIARSDFDFSVNAIPEPASLALVGGAFIGAGLVARRRSKKV